MNICNNLSENQLCRNKSPTLTNNLNKFVTPRSSGISNNITYGGKGDQTILSNETVQEMLFEVDNLLDNSGYDLQHKSKNIFNDCE